MTWGYLESFFVVLCIGVVIYQLCCAWMKGKENEEDKRDESGH